MSFTTTLQKALNVSSTEYVEGAEVSAYHYPGDTLDDKVRLDLTDDSEVTFDQQQWVEVSGTGHGWAVDTEGTRRRIYFVVHRPLCADDVESND